mmetsp:Transcript_44810/g.115978  ORF Transcript_44810/g.115978 Transcript_44810/m.115978 type:complete len:241 (+) Transcript_44810:1413-2135(+)
MDGVIPFRGHASGNQSTTWNEEEDGLHLRKFPSAERYLLSSWYIRKTYSPASSSDAHWSHRAAVIHSRQAWATSATSARSQVSHRCSPLLSRADRCTVPNCLEEISHEDDSSVSGVRCASTIEPPACNMNLPSPRWSTFAGVATLIMPAVCKPLPPLAADSAPQWCVPAVTGSKYGVGGTPFEDAVLYFCALSSLSHSPHGEPMLPKTAACTVAWYPSAKMTQAANQNMKDVKSQEEVPS